MIVNLDIRWRMGARNNIEFQPELFSLLQEIETTGSLLGAAKSSGLKM